MGAHIDHQGGKINGLAIDSGIHIAYGPKQNGVIELKSLNFVKRAQFHVKSVEESPVGDWADYLRGATKMLGERYKLQTGLCGVIEGSLPIGGLSSSSAVIISFLSALTQVNGIHLSPFEMISIARMAENKYVGVSCGKLDQSCEVLSQKDHLLYMDMQNDAYELIPAHQSMKDYRIAILFSGLERSLAGSKYNMRVDECKSAAYAMLAFAGMEYGKYDQTNLRDVPEEVYHQYKNRLPEPWRRRAEHYYSEMRRVDEGTKAWRRGDIERYGELCFESGYSSIYNYESGSDELKQLYHIMRHTKGIFGGRFSGAGFRGSCMALVDPVYVEEIAYQIEKEYLHAFPNLEGKFQIRFCQSADGVRL